MIKTKINNRTKYYTIILTLCLLLIGCSPIIIERNNTINRTINHTIYRNNTIIIPCNQTEPEIDTTIYDRDYVLGLIRQLKHYEKQQDDYYNYNDTNCLYDLNQSNIKRTKAENELCQWNSSWC